MLAVGTSRVLQREEYVITLREVEDGPSSRMVWHHVVSMQRSVVRGKLQTHSVRLNDKDQWSRLGVV